MSVDLLTRDRMLRLSGVELRAPRDGDGDGFYSPRKGMPDRTPLPVGAAGKASHVVGVGGATGKNDNGQPARTGVLGSALDRLEGLRSKLGENDRAELDRAMAQLRGLESSDVDDDDLIVDEPDEPDVDEGSSDLVMDSASGELTFTPYADGDIDVDWDDSTGGMRFTPQTAREVIAAVTEFNARPVYDGPPDPPNPPASVTTREQYVQWYRQWSAEWDATDAGRAHGSHVEMTTSDGEWKVKRYGSGVTIIGEPESVDAEESGILQLDDPGEGAAFVDLLRLALASSTGTASARSDPSRHRDRTMRILGLELRGMAQPTYAQPPMPMMADPAEPLTPADADRDYGDELDRAELDDGTAVVARSQGVLTIESGMGDQTMVHAAPDPGEAQGWAGYIDDGLDLGEGEVTEQDGLQVTRTADGLLLRWPEGDEHADAEDLDGVDVSDDEAAAFAQALRDMAQVTADYEPTPGDGQPAVATDPAGMRHRALQLLGVEVRAVDPKHPHYGKGVAGGKGGQFRPISAQIMDALTGAGESDGDPLAKFSQPQLKKAAEQLGLNPPKGMRLVPLKGLLIAHGRGEKPQGLPVTVKPSAPKVAKAVPLTPDGKPDLAKMKVADLKAMAAERGLRGLRTKKDLVDAIHLIDVGAPRGHARLQETHVDALTPGDHPDLPAAPSAGAHEQKIRDAIQAAQPGPTGWAKLAAVREEMAARGMGKSQQDAELKRLALEGKLALLPEENQKTLTQSDHHAALSFGNEDQHLVRIAEPPTAVSKKAAAPSAGGRIAKAEADILDAYKRNRRPGEWIGIADLRADLDTKGYSREEQDAALLNLLHHEPNVRIIPVANTKALKPEDHKAALHLGGEKLHAFGVDPNYNYPKQPRPGVPAKKAAPKRPAAPKAEHWLGLPEGSSAHDYPGMGPSAVPRPPKPAAKRAPAKPRAPKSFEQQSKDALEKFRAGAERGDVDHVTDQELAMAEALLRRTNMGFGHHEEIDLISTERGLRAKGLSGPAAVAPKTAVAKRAPKAADAHEQKVRDAYGRLRDQYGQVGLPDLRRELDAQGLSRIDQDAVFERMHRSRTAQFTPEDDQKRLTPAERQAAFKIGRTDYHYLIRIDEQPKPAPKRPAAPRAPKAEHWLGLPEGSSAHDYPGMGPSAIPRPPKPAPKATKADPAKLSADFAAAVERPMPSDRDRLKADLMGLTGAQLADLATAHGAKLPAGTKQKKVDFLVEHKVGFRLNSEAIRHGLGYGGAETGSHGQRLREIKSAMDAADLRGDREAYGRLHQERVNLQHLGMTPEDAKAWAGPVLSGDTVTSPGLARREERLPRVQALAARLRGIRKAEDIKAAIEADGIPSESLPDLADQLGIQLATGYDPQGLNKLIARTRAARIERLAQELETFNFPTVASPIAEEQADRDRRTQATIAILQGKIGNPAISDADSKSIYKLLRPLSGREIDQVAKEIGFGAYDASDKYGKKTRLADYIAALIQRGGGTPPAIPPQQRDRTLQLAARAAGQDVTPGHDQLHHYWTRDPEGLARWAESATPWQTLVDNLVEEVKDKPLEVLKKWASRWFIEVFHYAAGSDLNRVNHGHPPRGKLVGPG